MKIDAQLVTNMREARSWTREQLASRLSVPIRTVHRVELEGECSLKTVMSLAKVLEIDAEQLKAR